MNISQFFIHRPIFAGVLSMMIFLAGAIAVFELPITEYPEVVPPTVVVSAVYPGANPEVIADTVAAPLEQAINGVENMLYLSSQSTADGRLGITVTFALGTNINDAQVEVQNRVSRALPRLPEEVQRQGVTTEKSSPDLTMVVHLLSPDERYDMLYLSNYATLNVKDELARIEGVGSVSVFGAGEFAVRVWLNPEKIAALNLSTQEVIGAIREQNRQAAAGSIGAPPNASANPFQLLINVKGRLESIEEFEDIVVRVGASGAITKLKDVARIELGSNSYALRSLLNNQPAAAIPVFQRSGSNAIELSDSVRAKMEELKVDFPDGVEYQIVYDPTVFVRDSIKSVVFTLLEAIMLVVVVVVVFLQTWRASIIPLVAVPVSLVGTFAVMHLFGFSLNALSLFGLVLAIGIVVDDAIVVVENVERNIALGKSSVEATEQAMREVTGPIIATSLVLSAVFIPTAFISGLTGQFYKQFALTIAISTIISTFNSLTLSPALAAALLKPHDGKKDLLSRIMDGLFGKVIFKPFNYFFSGLTKFYSGALKRVVRGSAIVLVLYAGLMALTYEQFQSTPTGFVPPQDKMYLIAFAQLPDAANLDRTEKVIREMSALALEHPGVESSVAFPGLSINGFTNKEEQLFGKKWLAKFEFMLEDKLIERGGKFQSSEIMLSHVAVDGRLITGQNPTSTVDVATELVKSLKIKPVKTRYDIEDRTMAVVAKFLAGDKSALAILSKDPEQYHVALAGMYGFYYLKGAEKDSQLEQALSLMLVAQDVINNPVLDMNIAKTQHKLGKTQDAKNTLEQLLSALQHLL